jgi:hypothetical protein
MIFTRFHCTAWKPALIGGSLSVPISDRGRLPEITRKDDTDRDDNAEDGPNPAVKHCFDRLQPNDGNRAVIRFGRVQFSPDMFHDSSCDRWAY